MFGSAQKNSRPFSTIESGAIGSANSTTSGNATSNGCKQGDL
jgi:hypothetical protein